MRKRVLMCLMSLLMLLGTGCQQQNVDISAGVGQQLVTGITVTCQTCDSFTQRHYSDPDKLRILLLAIRSLGPDFPARTDVDALAGKTFSIRMSCANGQQTLYTIKNNLYVQKNGGPWRQISAEKAGGIWQMILELPPDDPDAMVWDPLPATPAQRLYFPAFRRFFRP